MSLANRFIQQWKMGYGAPSSLPLPSSRAIAVTTSSSFKKETDLSSPFGRQVMTLTLGIDQNKDAFPNMLDMRQICLWDFSNIYIKGRDLGVSGLKKGHSQSVSQGTQAVRIRGLRLGYAVQKELHLWSFVLGLDTINVFIYVARCCRDVLTN